MASTVITSTDLASRDRPDSRLDRWIAQAVMATVICSVVSVSGSGIFLGAAVAMWLYRVLTTGRVQLRVPPFGKVVLLFMVLVVVAIIFSTDPWFSLRYVKTFIRFVLALFIFTYFSENEVTGTIKGTLLLLAFSAGLGIIQFYYLFDIDLLNRIRGFMSHWMTFSGQLMMGIVALSGLILVPLLAREGDRGSPRWRNLTNPSPWLWNAGLALLTGALLLTFTRNAWLGTMVGVFSWLIILRRKWLIPMAAVVVVVFALLPGSFHRRILDGFNPSDTTTRTRLELLATGGRIVADHPFTGVGPRMVPHVADQYRSHQEFPDWLYQHLHNTPLQIAAEMGVFVLVSWLFIWAFLIRDFWAMARRDKEHGSSDLMSRFLCYNGICIVIAFLGAGLLEYNFGDSELVTLLIFFVTAPYVHSDGIQASA